MTSAEWEAAAAELASKHVSRITEEMIAEAEIVGLALPQPEHLRRALVEVDALLRHAPTPIQQRYKKLPESDLRKFGRRAQENFEESSLAWLDLPDKVAAAAGQARALDEYLHFHGDNRGKPTYEKTGYLCEATNTHVIPRGRAEPPHPDSIVTTTYRRRGIFRHRLLPAVISGYSIVPLWYRDLSLSFRRPGSEVFGAIFDDLKLVRREGFKGFVAEDAPCRNETATLAAHVDAAFAGGVTVAVWPELTMPPERRHRLSAALSKRSLEAPLSSGPAIVAAGSWHEIEGEKVFNRMHVLSGVGAPRFAHTKSLPLESNTLGVEELEPSYEIPVLIADDALISFAICRDFCESQISEVYRLLDVDLVVVPSFGDENTILAHCHNAESMSVDFGTLSFVVQQMSPNVEADGSGYVLPPGINGAKYGVESLCTDAPGITHPISFKRV